MFYDNRGLCSVLCPVQKVHNLVLRYAYLCNWRRLFLSNYVKYSFEIVHMLLQKCMSINHCEDVMVYL